MSEKMKRLILNSISGFAVVILAAAAMTLWHRHAAESQFIALAEIKSRQTSLSDAPADLPVNLSSSTSVKSYAYTENNSKEWLSINPHYMGWIQIPGTQVNYPFVRSQDNKDYLKKGFYNKPSEAGTIFMDYRNLGNFNDRHTILYGHNMKSGAMFHNLRYYRDLDFFQDNPLIELSGIYETKKYRVFSIYEVSADDYSLPVNFNDQEYVNYLKLIGAKSLHLSEVSFDPKRQLLTLTTCSYGVDNGRFILHALEVENQ